MLADFLQAFKSMFQNETRRSAISEFVSAETMIRSTRFRCQTVDSGEESTPKVFQKRNFESLLLLCREFHLLIDDRCFWQSSRHSICQLKVIHIASRARCSSILNSVGLKMTKRRRIRPRALHNTEYQRLVIAHRKRPWRQECQECHVC